MPAGGAPSGAPTGNTFFFTYAPFAWRPDSRGWTALISDLPYLRVRAYDLAASPPFHDTLIGSAVGSPPTLSAPHLRELLGFTRDGRAIGALWSEWGTSVFNLGIHTPAKNGSADVRRSEIALPPGTVVDGAALSPDGEQIAWALRREQTPRTLMDRLLFWMPTRRGPRAGLYVTRSDGTGGRILGWTSTGPRKTGEPPTSDDGLVFLRWAPDGQRIGFVCRGGLYVLPVEEGV